MRNRRGYNCHFQPPDAVLNAYDSSQLRFRDGVTVGRSTAGMVITILIVILRQHRHPKSILKTSLSSKYVLRMYPGHPCVVWVSMLLLIVKPIVMLRIHSDTSVSRSSVYIKCRRMYSA